MPPLEAVEWHRVILDESQYVITKNSALKFNDRVIFFNFYNFFTKSN